jgi:quercetin dioxygenase-like cupin family protein
MPIFSWNLIEKERLNPSVERRVIHAGNLTVAKFYLAKGAALPEHSHHNEQVTMLESGRLRFYFPDEEVVLQAGEVMQILPDRPHRVLAEEDCVVTDLFAPRRDDWVRGDDVYLRK